MATNISNFYRGDTNTIGLTITSNSIAYDITGSTIWFTLKKNKNDADSQASLQKEVTSHTNPSGGITAITLSATDTNIQPGKYFYDIQMKTSGGEIYTLASGTVEVLEDVTRSTS